MVETAQENVDETVREYRLQKLMENQAATKQKDHLMKMTEQQVDLLLKLTSFRSDNLIASVKACLIQGLGVRESAELHSVNISQLSRRLSALRGS